ncbi:unnamed protein product [Prorocentrum cordatum]|uniref:Uncharacterized protein n=1 Tax=Prorocentrum cordatum TaxID=2364126 RepID=A0ABN9YID2_9DINO|nr:unnamed protein product [Polarella glacialis]
MVEDMSMAMAAVRQTYVEEKENHIVFGDHAKRRWFDVQADESVFRAQVSDDGLSKTWEQRAGVVERGRPESLVLWKTQSDGTEANAPGPGAIKKTDWAPFLQEGRLDNRKVILHSDGARSCLVHDHVVHGKKRKMIGGKLAWLKHIYSKVVTPKVPDGSTITALIGTRSDRPGSRHLAASVRSAQFEYWNRGEDLWAATANAIWERRSFEVIADCVGHDVRDRACTVTVASPDDPRRFDAAKVDWSTAWNRMQWIAQQSLDRAMSACEDFKAATEGWFRRPLPAPMATAVLPHGEMEPFLELTNDIGANENPLVNYVDLIAGHTDPPPPELDEHCKAAWKLPPPFGFKTAPPSHATLQICIIQAPDGTNTIIKHCVIPNKAKTTVLVSMAFGGFYEMSDEDINAGFECILQSAPRSTADLKQLIWQTNAPRKGAPLRGWPVALAAKALSGLAAEGSLAKKEAEWRIALVGEHFKPRVLDVMAENMGPPGSVSLMGGSNFGKTPPGRSCLFALCRRSARIHELDLESARVRATPEIDFLRGELGSFTMGDFLNDGSLNRLPSKMVRDPEAEKNDCWPPVTFQNFFNLVRPAFHEKATRACAMEFMKRAGFFANIKTRACWRAPGTDGADAQRKSICSSDEYLTTEGERLYGLFKAGGLAPPPNKGALLQKERAFREHQSLETKMFRNLAALSGTLNIESPPSPAMRQAAAASSGSAVAAPARGQLDVELSQLMGEDDAAANIRMPSPAGGAEAEGFLGSA